MQQGYGLTETSPVTHFVSDNMASHLAGFAITPAVAVGMGTAMLAVLKLPLSAVVVATSLTSKSGAGAEPLIIVVVSYHMW
jgi:H+/Cl- antiporter ClcA